MASVLVLVVLASPASSARAQAGQPAPSGLYDSYSPIHLRPVGRLSGRPPTALPRWLDVRTSGSTSDVTFQPSGRVTWNLTYGPHGLERKDTKVDGVLWTKSIFTYDAGGRLVRKEVTGPGAFTGPWIYTYKTDARGRVIERTGKLIKPTLPAHVATEQWRVTWGKRIKASHIVDGVELRRDLFDSAGRVLRTDFMPQRRGIKQLSLVYTRGKGGALVGIRRILGGPPLPADFGKRDSSVRADHLVALHHSLIERHEALLLLGSPVTHSDTGKGAARRQQDNYSDGCWLNEISSLTYDPSALLKSQGVGCVCGFCVDAGLPVSANHVDGVDLHWTRGPWVRLDGSIDVTEDHEVMTPSGPRLAAMLQPGDVVLTPAGTSRVIKSVEVLPLGEERLGRNVRTASGTFGAGGILFRSEPECE